VPLNKVLSRFLAKILHLSIQAFERSKTHLAMAGTNPEFPYSAFSCFEGAMLSSWSVLSGVTEVQKFPILNGVVA
jgi:hypothetical protein